MNITTEIYAIIFPNISHSETLNAHKDKLQITCTMHSAQWKYILQIT